MSAFAELHRSLQKPAPREIDRDERRRTRESEYRRNAKLARRRDNKHCRICGAHQNLETHHVVPRSLAGKTIRDAMSNLLTVCHDCHELITRHVIKLYAHEPLAGANGKFRVERWSDTEGGFVLAMNAA